MATTTRSREMCDLLLDQADEEFARGDMVQASEKAWGAVERYVESVAAARGWSNGSPRDIMNNAGRLMDRTPDPDGNTMKFALINVLHVNFYDEELDPRDVELAVRDARVLIDAMREAEPRLPMGSGMVG